VKDMVTGKRWWSHGKSEPGSDKPSMIYWFQGKKASDGTISFTPITIDDASGIGTLHRDRQRDKLLDVMPPTTRRVSLEQVRVKGRRRLGGGDCMSRGSKLPRSSHWSPAASRRGGGLRSGRTAPAACRSWARGPPLSLWPWPASFLPHGRSHCE
jgi:hypothetical protein